MVLLDAPESLEVTRTAEIESLGGAMYDSYGFSISKSLSRMDLEEFSASLLKQVIGFEQHVFEVNSDEWHQWVRTISQT